MEEEQSTLGTLQPFIHQVGGHSSIEQLDKYTVCKPLFSKELRFYEEVCPAFKPFIPEFKGLATVKDGICQGHTRQLLRSSENTKFHTYRYGKHCTTCSCKHIKYNKDEDGECESESSSSEEEPDSSAFMNGSDLDNSYLEYILLENVVGSYKYPCILDLKMGTEKHKDYIVSKEEADRRQARWDQTTSKSLGVRVCGMKVYLINKRSFFIMSDGRDLTVDGFKDAIRTFLFNGGRFREEVIEPYLGQLRELLNVMETQYSYRFYNTSLLLIYEGEDRATENNVGHTAEGNENVNDVDINMFVSNADNLLETNVGVRMIDFAHVHYNQHNKSEKVPDEGYIFGLRSLIRILEEILVELRSKIK